MMRRVAEYTALLLACFSLIACDASDPLGLYPEPERQVTAPLDLTGHVVDAANLLTDEQEAALTLMLEKIEQDTLAQSVIVTTPSLEGMIIEDYSLALGRGWGIGDATRDDGLLLVIAPVEQQVRIEVGYGLEDRISDPFAAEVIREVLPMFPVQDYYKGITIAVDHLGTQLRTPELKKAA